SSDPLPCEPLSAKYDAMEKAFEDKGLVNMSSANPLLTPDHIYITEYPDPTTNTGAFGTVLWSGTAWTATGGILDDRILTISLPDTIWASQVVLPTLNGEVQMAAARHGWHFVTGISAGFVGHGYTDSNHMIVRILESLAFQGDTNGSLHPNVSGH